MEQEHQLPLVGLISIGVIEKFEGVRTVAGYCLLNYNGMLPGYCLLNYIDVLPGGPQVEYYYSFLLLTICSS